MKPLTKTNYQQYYEKHGLIETFHWFNKFVSEWSSDIVMPAYSFAHIVIDDYNVADGHIQFCLGEVNNYLIDKFNDLEPIYADPYADETWRSWQYWSLVEGADMTVDFLEWLLSVDEDERETAVDSYYGYDNVCQQTAVTKTMSNTKHDSSNE